MVVDPRELGLHLLEVLLQLLLLELTDLNDPPKLGVLKMSN